MTLMEPRQELKQICQKHGIALVYLFGSQAHKGENLIRGKKEKVDDPLADLDVGVVFRQPLPREKTLHRLYTRIYQDLVDLFVPLSLDLTFLEENHSVFQFNAICGICVYYFSEKFKDEFELNVMRRAADFKPFLEKYLDEYLEEAVSQDG